MQTVRFRGGDDYVFWFRTICKQFSFLQYQFGYNRPNKKITQPQRLLSHFRTRTKVNRNIHSNQIKSGDQTRDGRGIPTHPNRITNTKTCIYAALFRHTLHPFVQHILFGVCECDTKWTGSNPIRTQQLLMITRWVMFHVRYQFASLVVSWQTDTDPCMLYYRFYVCAIASQL